MFIIKPVPMRTYFSPQFVVSTVFNVISNFANRNRRDDDDEDML